MLLHHFTTINFWTGFASFFCHQDEQPGCVYGGGVGWGDDRHSFHVSTALALLDLEFGSRWRLIRQSSSALGKTRRATETIVVRARQSSSLYPVWLTSDSAALVSTRQILDRVPEAVDSILLSVRDNFCRGYEWRRCILYFTRGKKNKKILIDWSIHSPRQSTRCENGWRPIVSSTWPLCTSPSRLKSKRTQARPICRERGEVSGRQIFPLTNAASSPCQWISGTGVFKGRAPGGGFNEVYSALSPSLGPQRDVGEFVIILFLGEKKFADEVEISSYFKLRTFLLHLLLLLFWILFF